jgi:hypothetical protein
MITSKQIVKLSEDYFDTKNVNGHPLLIYINPSLKEVIESSTFSKKMLHYNEIRFVADNKKQQVFVWDSGLCYHAKVRASLGYSEDFQKTYLLLNGVASVKGSSVIMSRMDNFTSLYNAAASSGSKTERKAAYGYMERLLSEPWTWLNKYIQCEACLRSMRTDFFTIKKY